jgi:hypothetical protein
MRTYGQFLEGILNSLKQYGVPSNLLEFLEGSKVSFRVLSFPSGFCDFLLLKKNFLPAFVISQKEKAIPAHLPFFHKEM